MKNFETMDQHFFDFICERQNSVFQSGMRNDKRYIKVKSKLSKTFEKINALIPHELYLELDEITAVESSIIEDYTYRQGFFDGIRLMQMQNEPIKYRHSEEDDEEE